MYLLVKYKNTKIASYSYLLIFFKTPLLFLFDFVMFLV